MISKKVELKLKRVKLIQSGQEEEARKVLREYWAFDSQKEKIVVPNKNTEYVIKDSVKNVQEKDIVEDLVNNISKDEIKNVSKFNSIDDLVKIKGIGKETVKDIKKIYQTISNLVKALKSGENLPLRNDVERKLKKELI